MRFFDYRPPSLHLDSLEVGHADLNALPFASSSLGSLSCMHVVEHIGLGRYGDPLDPRADLRAMSELSRVVSPGRELALRGPGGAAADRV